VRKAMREEGFAGPVIDAVVHRLDMPPADAIVRAYGSTIGAADEFLREELDVWRHAFERFERQGGTLSRECRRLLDACRRYIAGGDDFAAWAGEDI
jgi:hypothetical protein